MEPIRFGHKNNYELARAALLAKLTRRVTLATTPSCVEHYTIYSDEVANAVVAEMKARLVGAEIESLPRNTPDRGPVVIVIRSLDYPTSMADIMTRQRARANYDPDRAPLELGMRGSVVLAIAIVLFVMMAKFVMDTNHAV